MKRIHLIALLLVGISGVCYGSFADDAPQQLPVEVPDEILKAMVLPRIDLAMKDTEYRKAMTEQMDRVFGDAHRELSFHVMIDMDPSVLKYPVILQESRKRLKLKKKSAIQIRIDYRGTKG